jgi:hypothetical protein
VVEGSAGPPQANGAATGTRRFQGTDHEQALVGGEWLYVNRTRGLKRDALDPVAIAEDRARELGLDVFEEEPPPPEGAVLTADEILAFDVPPIETLPVLGRPGLIMEGAANLLYSYPKTGKTELLTAMVAGWVSEGQRVFYLTEEGFPNWKTRLRVHHVSGDRLRMQYAWSHGLGAALDAIRGEVFDVLIIDTLRNTVGYLEGEGDKDVARVIHPLIKAANGATTICSFHARKMPGEGGRDISGHHSLYGAFDRAIQLAPVDGKDTHRKLTVSGRCMYSGDVVLEYRQVEPGNFEVLDGVSVMEPKSHTLVCLSCGEDFTARRRDARYCSDMCRQRAHRSVTLSDVHLVTDVTLPRGIEVSVTEIGPESDSLWLDGLTE